MHIEYLQYLVEVANSSSISAAAKKLYFSQTSLSAIIASLEKDLNITFFKRTHKGISVTPKGKQALEIIIDILKKHEELHRFSDSSPTINRIVNVVAYPSVANALSAYLARQFTDKHPDISLQIHELPYRRAFEAIGEGIANIAVAAENSRLLDLEQEKIKRGLEIEPLYEDRFCLIVSPEFRLADRESIDISEIVKDRLAFTHLFPAFQDRAIAPVIRRFNTYAIFNNVESVKQIVSENSAIALLPRIALLGDHRIKKGLLCQIQLTGFDTELTNYLLYEGNMLNVTERAVLSEIKDFYRDLSAAF